MTDPNDTTPADEGTDVGESNVILVTPRVHEQVDLTIAALAAANDPVWPDTMRRGRALVRENIDPDTGASLLEHTFQSLGTQASRVTNYGRMGGHGLELVTPPTNVMHKVLASTAQELAAIPPCDGIATAPYVMVTEAGEYVAVRAEGYNAESQLVLRTELEVPPVDLGAFDGTAAATWLTDQLLADFPMETPADRANALAALLTVVLRPAIKGPTPLFAFMAPPSGPGTGKGLLSRVVCIPSMGTGPRMQAPLTSREEEEWRKAISTLLLQAPRAVCFDNIADLGSAALAAALTLDRWTDRRMRTMEPVDMPVRNVWMATSNGLQLSQELARRVVPVYMNAEVEDPSSRQGPSTGPRAGNDADGNKLPWLHDDLELWVRANRGLVLYAVFTMVAWWQYRGDYGDAPIWGGKPLGSEFAGFTNLVGGILKACGVEGFLGNHRRLWNQAVGEKMADAAVFLRALYEVGLTAGPLTAEQVLGACGWGEAGVIVTNQALRDAAPAELVEARADARLRQLGYWLRSNNGAPMRGHRLVKDGNGRQTTWIVQRRAE